MFFCTQIKTFTAAIFCVIVSLNPDAKACLFSQTYEAKTQPMQPWEEEIYERVTEDCECGNGAFFLHPQATSWFFTISVYNRNNFVRTCTGTLVTSKMLLTSHNCLKISNGNIAAFELWNLEPRRTKSVFAKANNVFVSKSLNPLDPAQLKVTEIIYNKEWINREMKKSHTDGDFAILILDEAITITNPLLSPICVPMRDAQYDPNGLKAHYYGYGSQLETDPNLERREIGNAFVMPGKICDNDTKMEGFSSNNTLCIQSRLHSPTAAGGPLIMSKDGKLNDDGFIIDKTGFLIGLASLVKPIENASIVDVTYFSNIFPWIRYLEYHAHRTDATWCETPKLEFTENDRDVEFSKGRKRRYIWEASPPVKRDESLDCVCGLHNLETSAQQSRIVGGKEADPYEFPWLVHLTIGFSPLPGEAPRDDGLCGGSIINDRMILTAAHCIVEPDRLTEHDSKEWTADLVLITYKLHDSWQDPNEEYAIVKEIFFLRDYGISLLNQITDYDVALLLLEEPLKFSNAKKHGEAKPLDIRPICLPRQGKPINVVGKNATVAGWGLTGTSLDPDDWTLSRFLRKLQKPILPLEECSKRSYAKLRDSVLCAGFFNRYKDASEGDSGGPLIIRSKNGYWTQVGIVSFGVDSYKPNTREYSHTVALYANVQKFLKFIDYHSAKVGAKWCKSYV